MYAILVDVRLHTKELLLSFILSHRERDRYSDFQKRKWNLFKKKKEKEKKESRRYSFVHQSIFGEVNWGPSLGGGGKDGMEIKFRRVSSENSSGERGKETRGGRIVCGECPWIIERRGQG